MIQNTHNHIESSKFSRNEMVTVPTLTAAACFALHSGHVGIAGFLFVFAVVDCLSATAVVSK